MRLKRIRKTPSSIRLWSGMEGIKWSLEYPKSKAETHLQAFMNDGRMVQVIWTTRWIRGAHRIFLYEFEGFSIAHRT